MEFFSLDRSRSSEAIVFLRVSGGAQGEAHSFASQQRLAIEYVGRLNLFVTKTWQEVESASKEDQRAAFFEMVDFVKRRRIQHVIFDKVDRAVRGFKCKSRDHCNI